MFFKQKREAEAENKIIILEKEKDQIGIIRRLFIQLNLMQITGM